MWNAVMLAVLIAVAGVYTTRNLQAVDQAGASLAAGTAAEMGIYRNAVIAYFGEHDLLATSVATATLKSGRYLPQWSRMFQQTAPLAWNNYRDADGMIYVWAVSLPSRNLAAELAQLARNSVLLGVYGSTGTLYSPVAGDTGISLSALAGRAVPAGAPVWLAHAS